MLSHLRFHRRGPSNPTSPIPENNSPWDSAVLPPKQLIPEDGAVPAPNIEPRFSTGPPHVGGHGHGHATSSHPPPQPTAPPPLPPSTSSQQAAPSLPPIARIASPDLEPFNGPTAEQDSKSREDPRAPQKTPYNERSGFLGGLALQNYRREQQDSQRPGPHPKASGYGRSDNSAVASPTDRNGSPSFLSPIDQAGSTATGKRPPGARLHSDPQGAPIQNHVPEPVRDRRSIPFLKNPISNLLLRRKTSQNVLPELSLPLRTNREQPSYQPIRGTRVHDFSAPRPRRIVSSGDVASLGASKPAPDTRPPTIQETESPPQPAPPVPPKDADQARSTRTSSSSHSKSMSVDVKGSPSLASKKDSTRRQSSIPSSSSTLSRNTSAVSSRDVISSIPKHMKSTSSRFSFDMIGAAKAEKLLEEKHRQRQQEKQADVPVPPRDSRFDDFDEDSFDYDAMDYDDGLEEAIPGVNCDYDYNEEEDGEIPQIELDPDDDQQNFAGFVFQRSNPVSSMTSPMSAGLLPTPRDVDGNVIGYALTKESPELRRLSALSLQAPDETLRLGESPVHDSPTGLGIQGLDVAIEAHEQNSTQPTPANPYAPKVIDKDDELYFGGLGHEFEGEGDGSAIDESLFDLDDTDRFGRPIPGAFASALAHRMSTQETKKRESDDITSQISVNSGTTDSTAHTSLSVGLQQKLAALEAQQEENLQSEEPVPAIPDIPEMSPDTMLASQAALAAAVQQAAASGKFRRDSSPPLPAALTITSPTTSGSTESNRNLDEPFADYDFDDGFGDNGLDDYELDDDAIIAEANASALANDDDGWYGQEFGFYSAPLSQTQRAVNAANEQDAVYGGFFGPSGVTRSKSGHLVSREPNLTPITERSEYSNRNSIMSLQMPSSAGRDAPLQSPGLAQLAMMADNDNMTLSALLKLRSKAWGGSQASLVSSRDGSPSDRNGASSPMGHERDIIGSGAGHGRKNSAFSIWSVDSGAGSGSGSPTLTMSMAGVPNNTIPPLSMTSPPATGAGPSSLAAPLYSPPPPPIGPGSFPPVIEDEEADYDDEAPSPSVYFKSPTISESTTSTVGMPAEQRHAIGHRHRGSADSISYHKEDDSGETRWVMERRRTAESGEIEILGRQVVEGGRI